MSRIKVLIIDDSALIRQLLSETLSRDPHLEVVGTAADPYIAWEKIKQLRPDVLTLDIEMPRMDGLMFLEKLMAVHPLSVIMISSLTERGCDTTLRALELGAIDFVTKPRVNIREGTSALISDIIAKIKIAASVRKSYFLQQQPRNTVHINGNSSAVHFSSSEKIVVLGASTGGTEALSAFLAALPANAPAIGIVQHMPEKFTHAFAQRLDSLCRVRVSEARSGDRLLPGHVLIAPGSHHMEVFRSGMHCYVRVYTGPPVNHHCPSVDVFFHSCARVLGKNAVGVIMTGMGSDGARGLLAMRNAGAHTIAQDEASCVIFGMPKEAIALGAVDEVVPLTRISTTVLRMAGMS